MTLRVELEELPENVQKAIEAGEAVEIIRDGCTLATVPAEGPKTATALWEALAKLPPLDDDYERDIADGLSILRPQPYPWE